MTEKLFHPEGLALSHRASLLFLSLFSIFYWTFAGFELNLFEGRSILIFNRGNRFSLDGFAGLADFVVKMGVILFLRGLLSGNL